MNSGDNPKTQAPDEPSSGFHADTKAGSGQDLMQRDRHRLQRLEANPDLGPSLYLYRWREPTVSLGYAQRPERDLDLDSLKVAGIPVVRRPTGGRAILHVDEWTYSVTAPLAEERLGGSLAESFRRVASVVQRALGEIGVECYLAATDRPGRPDSSGSSDGPACFATALGFELTVGGRKLVGSAQRRLTRAYLQQGTILVGAGHERLAEFLRGSPEDRRRWRQELLSSTVTVREVAGEESSFEAFAKVLESAWVRVTSGTRGTRRPA
jgi:lipoate-protein ligase A